MTTAYEIPLKAEPQNFSISLNSKTYNISLQWNIPSNSWKIDIADTNNVKLVSGIPLVTGINLLEPFDYLNFGGQLIAQTDHDTLMPPSYENLGTNGHLYWVTA